MKEHGLILIALLAAAAYFLWKKFGGTTTTTVQSSVVGGTPNTPTTTVYDSRGGVAASVPGNAGPATYSPSQGWIAPPGFTPTNAPHSTVPVIVPNTPSTQQRVTSPIRTYSHLPAPTPIRPVGPTYPIAYNPVSPVRTAPIIRVATPTPMPLPQPRTVATNYSSPSPGIRRIAASAL